MKRFLLTTIALFTGFALNGQEIESIAAGLSTEDFLYSAASSVDQNKIQPTLQIINDTLFAAMATGIHSKSMTRPEGFTTYGLTGIPVLDFVCSGNSMMAICLKQDEQTDNLLLLSVNRGETFQDATTLLNAQTSGLEMQSLAQNPLNPESVLLATNQGIYKTCDFGETWNKVSDSVLSPAVLKFHPSDTNVIFLAGTSSTANKGIVTRMDMNTDEAFTFWLDGEGSQATDVLFNPENPEEMWFAGNGIEKIGRSQDGGKTWQTVNSETLGWTSTIFHCTKLFTNPQADTLFALAGTSNSEIYAWASTDKGTNWNQIYHECFFLGEVIVYPFDIVQYQNDLIFYFSSGIYRLNLSEITQEMEAIYGKLIHVDNPPLDNPPLPGMVWALESEYGQYILNYESAWIEADTKLVVDGIEYSLNDSVEISGRSVAKQDINENTYKELKIKSMKKITDAGIDCPNSHTHLLISPNPASETFAYQSKTPIKNWIVRNISGQLILQGDANQTEIDCQSWPAGLYIFEWETAGGQKGRTKIVKR